MIDRIKAGWSAAKRSVCTAGRKSANALAVGGAVVGTAAHAAVPTEATDALTALQTDGLSLIGSGWPVLGAIVGGLILMGIFKRVASKAAG